MIPWDDKLRRACRDLSADCFGDPPCFEVVPDAEPCEDCMIEVYGETEKPYRCPLAPDMFKDEKK